MKKLLDEGPARHAIGHNVCASCFGDDALQEVIESNSEPGLCDFCGGEHGEVAPLKLVVDHMLECILVEYAHADDRLYYESRDGGYRGWRADSGDLLFGYIGLDLPNDNEGTLRRVLIDSLGDQLWCEDDPYALRESEWMRLSWEDFQRTLWGGRRFSALVPAGGARIGFGSDTLAPLEFLEQVARVCGVAELVDVMPAGTTLFRAREMHPHPFPLVTLELGPAPVRYAAPNRMSAAGVSAFYGSDDVNVCLLEVGRGHPVAVGEFQTCRDLRILDLTAIPPVPSFFERASREFRQAVEFLHHFAEQVSAPLGDTDSEHVSYLPTQVVAEFLRFMFKPGGESIDGLWYTSAKQSGARSIVLFLSRSDLELSEDEASQLSEEERLPRAVSPTLRLVSAQVF